MQFKIELHLSHEDKLRIVSALEVWLLTSR
jgi:hypothetical protein